MPLSYRDLVSAQHAGRDREQGERERERESLFRVNVLCSTGRMILTGTAKGQAGNAVILLKILDDRLPC